MDASLPRSCSSPPTSASPAPPRFLLLPDRQAPRQDLAENARAQDLVLRHAEVVLDAVPGHLVLFQDCVAGAAIAVAGLSGRAHVDEVASSGFQRQGELAGAVEGLEAQALVVDPGLVRVAGHAHAREGVEDRPQLVGVQDAVGREHVLAHRVARRAVHEQETPDGLLERQVLQPLPARALLARAPPARLHAPARVDDRAARVRVEVRGVTEERLVVVAHQAPLGVATHEVDAELGIGAVADHVAETHELGHPAPADVGEDRLERFAVGVQVGDDGQLHGPSTLALPSSISRAAATTCARASASGARRVAPAALTWPPPPKRRARRLTSKSVLLRAESLQVPGSVSRRYSTTSTLPTARSASSTGSPSSSTGWPPFQRGCTVTARRPPAKYSRRASTAASARGSSAGRRWKRAPKSTAGSAPRVTSSPARARVSASVLL